MNRNSNSIYTNVVGIFFNLFIILLLFGQVGYSADSYRIPGLGGSAEIDEHGTKKNVVNNCAPDLFVPTKTLTEWITNFIPNKPACVDVFCASGDSLGLCSVCDGAGGNTMPADDSSCGTIDCDGKNYYYQSGTDSATSTNYCYYRNYVDLTSNRCSSVGACERSCI